MRNEIYKFTEYKFLLIVLILLNSLSLCNYRIANVQ